MKVITLIQPYATLIALGEKKFETRSWATKHRGDLLIHAGKKIDKEACNGISLSRTLTKHGYTIDNLPTGVIIAKANLKDCYEIYEEHMGNAVLMDKNNYQVHWIGKDSNEYHFGDYTHGRYAWELKDVEQIEHIPAKGQLSLWNYNLEV